MFMKSICSFLQQYVVKSKLTVKDHAVTVEETESLENVQRSSYEPYFIKKPQPAEFAGEGIVYFS